MISIKQLYQYYLQHPLISTDSRKIEQGGIFFALKGEHFNGNLYAMQALEKGAAYAVIDESEYKKDERFLLVSDVLKSLQDLANHHRKQFNVPILAITGSNGKTTTKELLSAVLSSQYKTHFTKGNFNNHIGVPLTLLEMPLDTEIAIIEMGANHPGEIAFLCTITEPNYGLITNIGKAHLEGFGGLEGVKKTKAELYNFLALNDGIVFINKDETFLTELAEKNTKTVFYTQSQQPSPTALPYEIQFLGANPYVRVGFLDQDQLVQTNSQLIGTYNFNNIMTAIAIGKYFKVPFSKIKTAIEQYIPSNNRSQIIRKGSNTFILDAYNANPSSMRVALDNIAAMKASKKVAILGDMLELGTYSQKEHQNILDYALEQSLDQVIVIGDAFEEVNTRTRHFKHVDELKQWFSQEDFTDTLFLVKGSRGIRLEQLVV